MASPVGSLYVELKLQSAKFYSGLKGAAGGLKGFAAQARNAMRSVQGLGAMIGVGVGGAGLIAGLKKAVDLARQQEMAERKLTSVLRSTGGAVGWTTSQLKEYASELQRVTNYGDEVTLNMMAMLATFKEIKGAVFKDAVAAVQDMATVMDTDLKSAVVQLGKALNDPILGITALTRVGVSFTQQQKDMIKALQQSGNMLEAQKIILAEVQSEFGGGAKALAEPIIQMKNAVGDLLESIGTDLLPYLREMAELWKRSAEDAQKTGKASGVGKAVGKTADTLHTAKLLRHISPLYSLYQMNKQGPMGYFGSIKDEFIGRLPSERAESRRRDDAQRRKTAEALRNRIPGLAALEMGSNRGIGDPRPRMGGTLGFMGALASARDYATRQRESKGRMLGLENLRASLQKQMATLLGGSQMQLADAVMRNSAADIAARARHRAGMRDPQIRELKEIQAKLDNVEDAIREQKGEDVIVEIPPA